jgi:pilus assembly protein CpaB
MRVDVLVTGRPPGQDDTVTTTVLQNIAVLSAGKTIQVDSKSQSISTPVVTLLVTPAQAESLILAITEGRIQLVLRNSTDKAEAETKGRDLRQLYGEGHGSAPPPAREISQTQPDARPPGAGGGGAAAGAGRAGARARAHDSRQSKDRGNHRAADAAKAG